ncbi:transposable element Tc1 transposase [Trichonephila clavipes]|nr:transposable element Tc1 transposase [Trichonephila clavipes]
MKKAGYHSRVVHRKPYISMTNQLKRTDYAKDPIHKPLEFWRTVIFSDEDNFYIFGVKGRKLVWRKPCTALQKEHLVPTVKTIREGSCKITHTPPPEARRRNNKNTSERIELRPHYALVL